MKTPMKAVVVEWEEDEIVAIIRLRLKHMSCPLICIYPANPVIRLLLSILLLLVVIAMSTCA